MRMIDQSDVTGNNRESGFRVVEVDSWIRVVAASSSSRNRKSAMQSNGLAVVVN